MKVKRQKHVRRTLTFYKSSFGFLPPYYVVMDGTFARSALKLRVNLSEQMPKYLENEVKLCTTSCCIAECEEMGSLLYGPLKIMRQYDIHPCGHEKKPIPASLCLFHLARRAKPHKYMVATQDKELSESVRKKGGIPLLYMAYNAINLEAPSVKSDNKAKEILAGKLSVKDHQHKTIEDLKLKEFGPSDEVKKKRRKKGPSGPNPLSCKKKSKNKTAQNPISETKTKRKRKKNKKGQLTQAVTEALKQ